MVLDHGGGVFSLYFHQSKIRVKAGDEVARGQVVGEVGSTGLSTGPHLHWEMRVDEVATNPLEVGGESCALSLASTISSQKRCGS